MIKVWKIELVAPKLQFPSRNFCCCCCDGEPHLPNAPRVLECKLILCKGKEAENGLSLKEKKKK